MNLGIPRGHFVTVSTNPPHGSTSSPRAGAPPLCTPLFEKLIKRPLISPFPWDGYRLYSLALLSHNIFFRETSGTTSIARNVSRAWG